MRSTESTVDEVWEKFPQTNKINVSSNTWNLDYATSNHKLSKDKLWEHWYNKLVCVRDRKLQIATFFEAARKLAFRPD